MDMKAVTLWVDLTLTSNQIQRAPSEDNTPVSLKRRRDKMGREDLEETPRKRLRGSSARTYSTLDLSETPSLSRAGSPSSTPSRPGSPKKDLLLSLRAATPPIIYSEMDTGSLNLPSKVLDLITELTRDFGTGLIPIQLKVSFSPN